MKTIGFIGGFDKADFLMYIAKALQLMNYRVMVVDTSVIQKTRYIVPAVNPTKSYITTFEDVDFAEGFDNWSQIYRYLGIKYDTNDEEDKQEETMPYDYILIDVDTPEKYTSFEIEKADKIYFVTSFDMYSLKKSMEVLAQIEKQVKVTKILFARVLRKDDEEYLNYLSLDCKVIWSDYTIYFAITNDDIQTMEDNQRIEKIKFKKLSNDYKSSLTYVLQDISQDLNINMIKKAMKE